MNLPDLLKRKDRGVELHSGGAEPCLWGAAAERMRAVRLDPGTVLNLREAHTYNALREFPSDVHWRLVAGDGVRIVARPHDKGLESALLCEALLAGSQARPLTLNWPLWTARSGFDISIQAMGARPVTLTVGRLFDPREKMGTLIRGRGLELGPGLNPRIRPTDGVEIEYVEERTPEEWDTVYGRGRVSMAELSPDVLKHYRVGSAVTLHEWPPCSLDFVFSNHVFEHLMNPLQVLRNWLSRLKSGGVLLAVVPDTRFTFDLRQKTSTIQEMLSEQLLRSYAVTEEKYQRWCSFTSPTSTIENLKERKYSVHVHYYTPSLIRSMADILIANGECSGVFVDSATNNKDFGVVLRR